MLTRKNYATAQFVPAPTDLVTKKGHADIDVRYKEVPPGITCTGQSLPRAHLYRGCLPENMLVLTNISVTGITLKIHSTNDQ
jgi:hypothetical protein